jgi:ABC-type bacteriocin/lantibiotic exporter with double-glycine peptidase domain
LTKAIEMARLSDCIAALPERLEEKLGERGSRLSGGQRQKLGIARALYREAPVLILDEATSSLDNRTEAEIVDMLESLRPERTLLMIAHRLTALRHCETIYELVGGRIGHSSRYAQLQSMARVYPAGVP